MSEQAIKDLMGEIAVVKAKQDVYAESVAALQPLSEQVARLNANLENLVDKVQTYVERNESLSNEIDVRLTRHGERLGEMEKAQTTSNLLVVKLQQRADESEADVKELKMRGAKRWDGLMDKALYAVAGAAFMLLLYQFGWSGP